MKQRTCQRSPNPDSKLLIPPPWKRKTLSHGHFLFRDRKSHSMQCFPSSTQIPMSRCLSAQWSPLFRVRALLYLRSLTKQVECQFNPKSSGERSCYHLPSGTALKHLSSEKNPSMFLQRRTKGNPGEIRGLTGESEVDEANEPRTPTPM